MNIVVVVRLRVYSMNVGEPVVGSPDLDKFSTPLFIWVNSSDCSLSGSGTACVRMIFINLLNSFPPINIHNDPPFLGLLLQDDRGTALILRYAILSRTLPLAPSFHLWTLMVASQPEIDWPVFRPHGRMGRLPSLRVDI